MSELYVCNNLSNIKAREEDLIYAVDMMKRIYRYREHKVLVVDSDDHRRAEVKRNLEALMLKVLATNSANEALEITKRHKLSAIMVKMEL